MYKDKLLKLLTCCIIDMQLPCTTQNTLLTQWGNKEKLVTISCIYKYVCLRVF